MTARDHVYTELGGYVLGALEPEESEAVREHLARCSECAAEHARLAGLPALLSLAARSEEEAPLSPAVEERVLDAVARERPAQSRGRGRLLRRRGWAFGAVAAAAAVAAVLAILVLGGGADPAPRYGLTLQPAPGERGAGRAELASTSGGTTVHLWLRDLPPDPGVVYEVHCDAPDWTASAGTFRADERGRAIVVLTTAARRGEYDRLRVVRRSDDAPVLTASLN